MFRLKSAIRGLRKYIPLAAARRERSHAFIALDMLWCILRYRIGPTNYYDFGFDDPHTRREEYISYAFWQRLLHRLNGPIGVPALDDKKLFIHRFAQYLHRKTLALDETTFQNLIDFISSVEKVVLKPRTGLQGGGVEILEQQELSHLNKSAERIWRLRHSHVIEEFVSQHPDLTRDFGTGLAVVRLVVVRSNTGTIVPVLGTIYVDSSPDKTRGVVNIYRGALGAILDINSGIIRGDAIDVLGNIYNRHPKTDQLFDGYQVPMWPQILNLAETAMELCTEAGLIGWDIGLTVQGPVLIEGNSNPGTYTLVQNTALEAGRGYKNDFLRLA